jgi:hypothetical protein
VSSAIAALTLNGGTFRVSSGTGQVYYVGQIFSSSGGAVDYTGAGSDQLAINSSNGITINNSTTWLSPANGSTIGNNIVTDVPIMIPAGVTFTNGISFSSSFGAGFRVTGGGTLLENPDGINVLNMNAPLTIVRSRYQVTDVSTNLVGALGGGVFTLDGGTLSYATGPNSTSKAITLTSNGGTIEIPSVAATLVMNNYIVGPGGLTKTGTGTLILNSVLSTFTSLTINAGSVQTANDGTLGMGAITINPGGTLGYTGNATTSRTFNINSGTLSVASMATLMLSGATVNGGFLRGAGTYNAFGGTAFTGGTTFASTTISQSGPGSYTSFTNGGTLTMAGGIAAPIVFDGFSNEGSGAITIGAVTKVNASDFQTYGTLTLNPAVVGSGQFTELVNTGTSQMFFNGGSRTFIGTPATANSGSPPQPTFVAGIDLNGKNAIVAGGLLVNNGFVIDSSNGGVGTATIVADFGALVKGAGFYQNPVITQNGGRVQAGNSPGIASFGRFVFGPGGVNNYVFAIDDATGTAGPSPDALGHVSGWGLIKAVRQSVGALTTSGDFTWTATPTDRLTVAIDTLVNPTTVGADVPGAMADFDPNHSYSWPAAHWVGTYSGPPDSATLDGATNFDTSGFLNPTAGTFGWELDPAGQTLSLVYTPSAVPEPGTLALTAAALGLGWRALRRRSFSVFPRNS